MTVYSFNIEHEQINKGRHAHERSTVTPEFSLGF